MYSRGSAAPRAGRALAIWSQVWRIGLCLLLGALYATGLWDGLVEKDPRTLVLAGVDVALMLLLTPLLVWRRSRRVLVTTVLVLATAISSGTAPAAAVAVMTVAETRRRKHVVLFGLLWVFSFAINDQIVTTLANGGQIRLPRSAGDVAFVTIVVALSYVVPATVGWSRGARDALAQSWRVSAELAQREQIARVAQAQTAERARIAREMHDVLAHKISLISLHAGVLTYQEDLTREESAATAQLIRETAHQALEELREVLGVLRDADSTAIAPPQPSLLDLPRLVAQEEAAGSSISLRVPDDFWPRAADLGPSTARHAHRIVQETLTNARKHAAGLPVEVEVDGDPERGILITVRNPVGSTPSKVPGSGLGLAGLRERAALAGGRLEVETTETEFTVSAHLPWNVRMGS